MIIEKDKKKKRSGRSKSISFPLGERRKYKGQDMAPKSLRRKGKFLLSECSEKELERAGVKGMML